MLGKGHIDLSASGVTRANGGNVNFTTPLISNTDETQSGQGTLRIFANGTGTSRSAGSVNLIVGSIDKGTVLLSASGVDGAGGGNVNASITSVVGSGSAGGETSVAQLVFSEITTDASGVIEIQAMTEGAKGINGVSIDSAERIVIKNGGIKTQGNANGNGNDVSIASSRGILISSSIESDAFAINANGSGAGSGGAISFESPDLKIQGSAAVTADGGTSGAGGTITNALSTINVSIGDVEGAGAPVQLLARGGTSAGSGGQLRLNAQNQVRMISSVLDVSARSVNGNGGSVIFESPNLQFGDQAASSAVTVKASAGVNKGTAGAIRLSGADSSSADQITVAKDINLFAGSRTGELVIKTNTLVIENASIMNGEAHNVDSYIQTGTGDGVLSLNVSGTGTGKGNGTITLKTHDLNFAQTELFAQGHTGAKAGKIQINEANGLAGVSLNNVLANAESDTTNDANSSITINSENDLSITDSTFSALGKSGGSIDISISVPNAGILTLNNVSADASGTAGSGGKIDVVAHNIIQNGSIELIAAGTGSGGTINFRQGDSTVVLTLGDEHIFRVNADGQWKSNPPSVPSISLISAGGLILGELAAVTSSSSSVGSKTYGGYIRLMSGNEQAITVDGFIAANGTGGRVEIFAGKSFSLTNNGVISAVGSSSSGSIRVHAESSTVSGLISASGKNGEVSFNGSKLDLAVTGIIRGGKEIAANANSSSLMVDLHGILEGELVLDGNTIQLAYGSNQNLISGTIRIAHAFAEGNIAIRNNIATEHSAIVVTGREELYAIRSEAGTIELRAADSISLEGARPITNSLNKIRANNVILNQVAVDGPANTTGFIAIGSTIESNVISIRADGNILGGDGMLVGNEIAISSSGGNIGSKNSRVQIGGIALEFLPILAVPKVSLLANMGSTFLRSRGGILVEHADIAGTFGVSNTPGLFNTPNSIELASVGEQIAPLVLDVETSQQSNGSIIISGPVKALQEARIEAGGSGNIEGRPVGLIDAPSLELRTLTGNIFGGSLSLPTPEPVLALNVKTGVLKINAQLGVTGGTTPGELPQLTGGTVLINNTNTESLTVKSSTAGLLLAIRTGGRLEISAKNTISAASIVLAADAGHLTVEQKAVINATNGSVELFARETVNVLNGSKIIATGGNIGIVGGAGVNLTAARITADANGGNASVGNVSIATLTPSETELVPATDLENFVVNGAVLWGSGRVRAINGANRASGNGRVVSFDSSQGNIVLDKGTVITGSGSSESELSPIALTEFSPGQGSNPSSVSFANGNHVWRSTEDLNITLGEATFRIKKGKWVQSIFSPGALLLRNLSGGGAKHVIVEYGAAQICLNAGEEFIVGNSRESSVPFRGEREISSTARTREFSIPALIASDKVIAKLYTLHADFRNMLLKTAVCLSIVTGHHGAYKK